MDAHSKVDELNLTPEEINRLSNAFKDEKFRELLKEYAEEISNPENKKRYEEEITLLEQERGMDIRFVHPKPERVLQTSLNGKQKCYINICSNELMAKPECKSGKSPDGKIGQHWSLPYSVTPGRPDVDSKGNKHMIYDVIFHPDTLGIAGKNTRFMKLVDSTAIQGIQDQFEVKLDETNVIVLRIKYKGVPNPSVIRKAIPGHSTKVKQTDSNDPLNFPYPYDRDLGKFPKPKQQDKPAEKVDPDVPQKSTEPRYTIKYRSYVDLQDYRYARDSAPGPRPKEMIIIIDLPLLKSAGDAELSVTQRHLRLESQKPAYRLELTLSYPVDEENGAAKFNKVKRQLTVTLPVLPLKNPLTNSSGHLPHVSDLGNNQGCEVSGGNETSGPVGIGNELTLTKATSPNERDYTLEHNSEMETSTENAKLFDQLIKQASTPELSESVEVTAAGASEAEEESLKSSSSSDSGHQCNISLPVDLPCEPVSHDAKKNDEAAECEENANDKADARTCCTHTDRFLDTSLYLDHCTKASALSLGKEEMEGNAAHLTQASEATPPELPLTPTESQGTPDYQPSTPKESQGSLDYPPPKPKERQVSPYYPPSGEYVTNQTCEGNCPNEPEPADVLHSALQCTDAETLAEADEGELASTQGWQTFDNELPPTILKEVNPQDGTMEVISDHTTSAAFSFQNPLLYDLD